jgi:hypothetical protein
VEQQNRVLEQFAQRAPAPAPTPQQQQYQQPGAEDFVTGQSLQQYGEQFRQQFTPDLQHVINANADMALDRVKQEYAEHFTKYGPEITANLASLTDKRAWTLDNLRKVVKFTLVDHVDDLAREKAARIAAEMEPTLRSTGAGGPLINHQTAEYSLASEKLPAEWKKRAAEVGLTESAVDEFCRANDMTRETFYKQFATTAITEGSR